MFLPNESDAQNLVVESESLSRFDLNNRVLGKAEYEAIRLRRDIRKKTCFIYLIQNLSTGNVKIGKSENPLTRFSSLQSSTDCELKFLCQIIGDEILEQKLHLKFKQYSIRGEWFRYGEEIQKYFSVHIQELEKRINDDNILSQPSRKLLTYLSSCDGGMLGKAKLERIARSKLDMGKPLLVKCLNELKYKNLVVVERVPNTDGYPILTLRCVGGVA
jgi:Meiotically up-regulated gene 113